MDASVGMTSGTRDRSAGLEPPRRASLGPGRLIRPAPGVCISMWQPAETVCDPVSVQTALNSAARAERGCVSVVTQANARA